MAVGEEDMGDIKLQTSAKYKVEGETYKANNVYSDVKDRKRRDIFVSKPDSDNLPENTPIMYQGNQYKGELSFRYGSGGAAIPVYQWHVQSRAEK